MFFAYSLSYNSDLEGIIKKKNSAGAWKDRYAMFEQNYFKTFRPKNGQSTTEVKENVDLKDIECVTVLTPETMKLELKQGTVMLFQSKHVSEWANAIQSRTKSVLDEYNNNFGETLTKAVHIEGWLMKKSHNKYQGLQVRIFLLRFL